MEVGRIEYGPTGPAGSRPWTGGPTGATVVGRRLFLNWLSDTLALQRLSYGKDPQDGSDPEAWLTYIREQTLAAFVELGEFITNLRWKPWAAKKLLPTDEEREDAIEEMVDVLHFVANNLVALGCTDQELDEAYRRKMNINRERMATGGHRT